MKMSNSYRYSKPMQNALSIDAIRPRIRTYLDEIRRSGQSEFANSLFKREISMKMAKRLNGQMAKCQMAKCKIVKMGLVI